MIGQVAALFHKRKILILGFGREGRSTLEFLTKYVPGIVVGIADRSEKLKDEQTNFPDVAFHLGADYLEAVSAYDMVMKSPGIALRSPLPDHIELSSQTDIFLRFYVGQTIGVTGTKGKSTTSSMIHYLLRELGHDSLLTGNIGIPCFDIIPSIKKTTYVVFELSANQLEHVKHSPHIAVLLNIFEEHLDFFGSFEAYAQAKAAIFRYGKHDDLLISTADTIAKTGTTTPQQLADLYPSFENLNLKIKGKHNLFNARIALTVIQALGLDANMAMSVLPGFSGLPHRLEFVGIFHGIEFYNDSIATIPEATIAALETLERVDFLILGGFDRGIDYQILYDYLSEKPVGFVFLTGKAGQRISRLIAEIAGQRLFYFDDFEDVLPRISTHGKPGDVCLLSPAAASYDRYMNFEHRGERFKQAVESRFGKPDQSP